MMQTQRTSERDATPSQSIPSSETNREEFLSDRMRDSYQVSFRLTQTESVSGQVGIHELVEFIEEVRWLAVDKYNLPVETQDVTDHDVHLTMADLVRDSVDDRDFERDVEDLAEEHGIGLCKIIGFHKTTGENTTYDGGMFVKYTYGWGWASVKENVTDPLNPTGRVEWVGGFRGQPDTMTESSVRITDVRKKSPRSSILSKLRNTILSVF